MVLLDSVPHKEDVIPGDPGSDPVQTELPRSRVRWRSVGKWLTGDTLSGGGLRDAGEGEEEPGKGITSACEHGEPWSIRKPQGFICPLGQ